MKVFEAMILSLAAMVAGSASAQVSFTPRVSHNYLQIKGENVLHTDESSETETVRYQAFLNSHKFNLELAYGLEKNVELLLDIGYTPVSISSDYRLDIGTVDAGARWKLGNSYAQVTLGNAIFKGAGESADSNKYSMLTMGLGLGYKVPLNSSLALDIFYRGALNLTESNKNRNDFTSESVEDKFVGYESHQLGLGVVLSF